MIRIIKCKTGLPEQTFRSSVDFPGDVSRIWQEDTIYRIVCDRCGLIDKSATKNQAESIKNRHKH